MRFDDRREIRRRPAGIPVHATWAVAASCLFLHTGCPTAPPIDPDGVVVDGNQDPDVTSTLGKTQGEPNGTFDDPIVAVFEAGVARLQGTVVQRGDLDVFLLGPLNPGDLVTLDADTPNSALDISVGLFDDDDNLVYENDDRANSGPRALDAQFEFVIRHPGQRYALVATNAAFAQLGTFTGSYRITISVVPNAPVPGPVTQVLFLDFDGAVIDSPILGTHTFGPFDASGIASLYAGQTETIKANIIATTEQNYERFNVTILTSDDGPPPVGIEVATISFGGFNSGAYGIAEHVDLYNSDLCDDGVVFTRSFAPGFFTFNPSAAQMGIAIGNVTSHEAGHLLGLNHTDDDQELMDDESAADAFLADQEFGVAPLSSDIMRIGFQDAVTLLGETVGFRSGQSARVALQMRRIGADLRTPAGGPVDGRMYRRTPTESKGKLRIAPR